VLAPLECMVALDGWHHDSLQEALFSSLSLSFFFSTCKRKGDRGALTWAMVADEWRSGDSVCKCERRTSVDATVLMWLALAASEGGWSLPPSRTTTGALELSASVARLGPAHIFSLQ
jgi:hypothetical protein